MKRLLPILLLFLAGCAGSTEAPRLTYGKSVRFPSDGCEDTIRLSPMNEGETASTGFMVVNRSGRPIVISRVESGCGCTAATWSREQVKNGDETAVNLMYNSSGQFGRQFKTIEVITEDGCTGRIFLAAEVRF